MFLVENAPGCMFHVSIALLFDAAVASMRSGVRFFNYAGETYLEVHSNKWIDVGAGSSSKVSVV